jgi:mono/diheme cytochrome c family protein
MIVLALATENKIAIAAMGAIFIAFALVSSFVLPRRSPNFPNRKVGVYVVVTVALFAAMLTTIIVFGVEEEPAGGEARAAETSSETGEDASDDTGVETERGDEPGATETQTGATETETEPGGSGGGGQGATGDAAAGKQVFASAGCTGCHTLEAAGSSGNVGPNLDQAKPDRDLIHLRVTKGKGAMPPFKGQLSDEQIADVVEFVYSSTHG